MSDNSEKFENLEKQIGTLKFVVLIMAVALIYNSAMKTGMFGEYRITANTIVAKKILLKGEQNQNLGNISVDENNKISFILSNKDNQLSIQPDNIKFLENTDSVDRIILKIPR